MQSASAARSRVTWLLLLWAAVFAASYLVPQFIAPTGDSFLRGFNRVVYWFWLQVGAFVLAIAVWVSAHSRRADVSNRLLWLSRVPLLAVVAEAIVLLAIIVWAGYFP